MSENLEDIAAAMMATGQGILAADESTGTIKKRFDQIGVENTEDNRRDYREMLFRAEDAMNERISGVILYDETIRQKAKDGTPLVDLIKAAGAVPGIKVDKGAKPLAGFDDEKITEGLDGLRERLASITTSAPVSPSGARSSPSARRCRPRTASPPTPMRWRATRRCARKPASCRSSSRKC